MLLFVNTINKSLNRWKVESRKDYARCELYGTYYVRSVWFQKCFMSTCDTHMRQLTFVYMKNLYRYDFTNGSSVQINARKVVICSGLYTIFHVSFHLVWKFFCEICRSDLGLFNQLRIIITVVLLLTFWYLIQSQHKKPKCGKNMKLHERERERVQGPWRDFSGTVLSVTQKLISHRLKGIPLWN